MVKKYFLLLLLIISSNEIFAQNEKVSSEINMEETGIWSGAYIKIRLSEKLAYYGEHHWRVRNSIDNVNSFYGRPRQFYNRFGLNIIFNKYFEAVIGPTLVLNFSPDMNDPAYDKISYEPRIWHQWLLKMPAMGRVKVFHQFRFEHRWKRTNVVDSDYDYTNRYRYKLFMYIPLNSSEIKVKSWYFSPSVELFMHSGPSIAFNPMEDFRTYNGIGYVYNEKVTFFAGHMYTIGQKSTGFEYKSSHIIRFNVFIGLDTRNIGDKLPRINLGY